MSIPTELQLKELVFKTEASTFQEVAIAVFRYQYAHSKIYKQYCDLLRINASEISQIETIPFLPIEFFKLQTITTTEFKPNTVFESSGTSGQTNSKHLVKDLSVYESSFMTAFYKFYGSPKDICIIGLLPSYLERKGSSLVYMVEKLIAESNNEDSGFYLYDFEKLKNVLLKREALGLKTMIIGVTFALLDFTDKFQLHLKHTIIMETGGMKGRREELSRNEVHHLLTTKLGVEKIHSEYGMTELLSQAYSNGDGIFNCPHWMKILIRSEDDPLEVIAKVSPQQHVITGAVNIIDLANFNSCAFIATDDLGKLYYNNNFEIIGRLQHSDLRGCSLMVL